MQQFIEDFTIFMNLYAVNFTKPDQEYIQQNFTIFYKLYEQVKENGGFIMQYSVQEKFLSDQDKKVVKIYKKYLLSFEYYQQKKLTNFMDHTLLKKAHRVNVQNYIMNGEYGWLDHQISVFAISKEQLEKMNNNLFTLEAISKNHGSQLVDIRIQNPKTDSFRPRDYTQRRLKLTINEYMEYQKDQKKFIQNLIKNGNTQVNQDNILFAVNVDMDQWIHESNALREVVPELSFGSKDDGLSYLRQHILGITIPQIYIKVSDVFTGGHQEHLAVSAININHGPGKSVWISIDSQFVQTLRTFVHKETQNDIMVEEGLWFREAEYFIQKGMEVKYTVQNPGEIIILGPGCLHLVRSEGISVQSAWNIMSKDLRMVESMFNRFQINQQVNYQTVIPIKTLFLDIYNHEKLNLDPKVQAFMQRKLLDFYQEERQCVRSLLDKISQNIRYVEYQSNTLEVISCSNCWHEIFIYFYMKSGHKQGGAYDFYCVNCMEKELKDLVDKTGVISMKYKAMVLGELLGQTNFYQCLDALCFTNYVGSVDCKRLFKRSENPSTKNIEDKDFNVSLNHSDHQLNQNNLKISKNTSSQNSANQIMELEINVDELGIHHPLQHLQKATMGQVPNDLVVVQIQKSQLSLSHLPEEAKIIVRQTKKIYKTKKPNLSIKKVEQTIEDDEEEIQIQKEVIPIKKKVKVTTTNQDTQWNG